MAIIVKASRGHLGISPPGVGAEARDRKVLWVWQHQALFECYH